MSVARGPQARVGNVATLGILLLGVVALGYGGIPQGLLLVAGAIGVSPRVGSDWFSTVLGLLCIAAGLVVAA